jgi:hypothetical protein
MRGPRTLDALALGKYCGRMTGKPYLTDKVRVADKPGVISPLLSYAVVKQASWLRLPLWLTNQVASAQGDRETAAPLADHRAADAP